MGVLEVANESEWGAPSFAEPKPKSYQVRFISDFRNINKQLKHKSYPMTNINGMLLKLEGFHYATSIDLNMGYYHTQMRKNANNLCTILLLWGNVVTSVYQWELITHQKFSTENE